MSRLFGVDAAEFGDDAMLGKLEGMKDVIQNVNQQFKDPVRSYILCSVFKETCYRF